MRTGDKKIFQDKEYLATMINMRRNGFSLKTIGFFFGVDHSSVKYQMDKYYITPLQEVFSFEGIINQITSSPEKIGGKLTRPLLDGVRLNRGKSYFEYLKAHNIQIPRYYW